MELRSRCNPGLPRLAWCARVNRGVDQVTVEHGPWVEVQPQFFFEGAWSGPFEAAALYEATAVLGSGGMLHGDDVVFIPSSHTLERLYSVRLPDAVLVSNSLVYLLAVLGDALDPAYIEYEADFLSILKGYHRARRSIPTRARRKVTLHYHARLRVGRDLAARDEPPPPLPRFPDYRSYVSHLEQIARDCVENARDRRRTVQYAPLASVSTGYDSPACAVVARACGCDSAVTFARARMELNASDPSDADDGGEAIAERLGMAVEVFDRSSYLERSDHPEAEFLATGNGGDDVIMSVLADRLPGTVFFTGFRGDTIWGFSAQAEQDSAHFRSKDPSGASLGEFRLRLGFIHAPLPVLTMPRHGDILAISQSPEMAPWRLGNDYDRPIPRRLVESSGVSREAFGQEKKAITQPFWVTRDNTSMFSGSSWKAIEQFSHELGRRNRESLLHRVRRGWAFLCLSAVWRGGVLAERLDIRFSVRLPMGLRLLTSETGYKFHWAVSLLYDRYSSSTLGPAGAAESFELGSPLPGAVRD